MARRKQNPLGTLAKVGLVALAAVGVAGIASEVQAREKQRRKAAKKKKGTTKRPKGKGEAALSGIYAPGAALGNAPLVTEDVMLPIELSFEPDIRDPQTGDIVTADSNLISDISTLHQVVTNLTSDGNTLAYDQMSALVAEKGVDMTDPTARDAAIQEALTVIAPEVDWSQGLQPYAFGSPEVDTWIGVQTVGEIAHQSHWNKQAAQGG